METKEMKIVPPEGYVIDTKNSTFECIKFKKKKQLAYEDVAKCLLDGVKSYYTDAYGVITSSISTMEYRNPNKASSKKQLEKLLAINKLMNVAKYLNGDWKPNWDERPESKYFINVYKDSIKVDFTNCYNSRIAYFKSEELAKQAIDILGEETIRLALSTDW